MLGGVDGTIWRVSAERVPEEWIGRYLALLGVEREGASTEGLGRLVEALDVLEEVRRVRGG